MKKPVTTEGIQRMRDLVERLEHKIAKAEAVRVKTYEVVVEKTIILHYVVSATNEDEAIKKYERGEYARELPGEPADCDVLYVVERG